MSGDYGKDHCMGRTRKPDIDKLYCMKRTPKRIPFPHTEVTTRRPKGKAKPEELSDDLLNWLAWAYVGPKDWRWAFRGVRKHYYAFESKLDRIIDLERILWGSSSPEAVRDLIPPLTMRHKSPSALWKTDANIENS